jgi:hypothetical protein
MATGMKRPDLLGLKCDTITSPRRLLTTFLTSNSTEFKKGYYNTGVQAQESQNIKRSRKYTSPNHMQNWVQTQPSQSSITEKKSSATEKHK